MSKIFSSFAIALTCTAAMLNANSQAKAQESTLRPPAVPLIACDPYFSVWSQADHLYDTNTTHWTGKEQALTAMLRVDTTIYRLMGSSPADMPVLRQTSLEVLPTQTIYKFEGGAMNVSLTFTTPSLPDDLMILSRPVTYVTCEVQATDNNEHFVEFYLDASGTMATNTPDQTVVGKSIELSNAVAIQFGTKTQQVLAKSGDDLRIDWGYMYVAAPSKFDPRVEFADAATLHEAFKSGDESGFTALEEDAATPASQVAGAVKLTYQAVTQKPSSRYVVLAYDDLYSIQYMKTNLRPYWRKDGWQAADLIQASVDEYDSLIERCKEYDAQLMADLTAAGGSEYADIAALAYRQCFAAGKFVADANGQPLQFCKENHSNGCIATSDLLYPMGPQFYLFGPTLTKSVLVPFMNYAGSSRWKFPFAPHDLGTYPHANGQRYGGGELSEENQMPVEESGNLLIMFAVLAKMEGNAEFAKLYWPQLTQWANYLQTDGFDPANQLSTDDFAGHMAHNVNLSVKAICGLGSYAMMCKMQGLDDEATKYAAIAKKFADQWVQAAREDDHYRLAFDREDTWSQKYNLVWDKILGLNLFPDEVAQTEMKYYRKMQNQYGLPLDNRSDYTKLDWILWTATLTQDREDFEALVRPVYDFLNRTPDRSPMTDWYFTSTAKKRGFTARPVVGGVFLQMLYDTSVWNKYASMDKTKAADWAPMPIPPKTMPLISTSEKEKVSYAFTMTKPTGDWSAVDYDASKWKQGPGGFGTADTPGSIIGTKWNTADIWLRRTVTVSGALPPRIALRIHHDEDSEVFINGVQVATLSGWTTGYETYEIDINAIHAGENVIAIHTHQNGGGQYIDVGIDAIIPAKK